MSQEKIELMVEGGKATPNASLSQLLGSRKIDIPAVLDRINEKTSDFMGMKIPVKLLIDNKTNNIDFEIITPKISELIKKEIAVEKGSGEPNKRKVGNIAIEQVIKIAKMKSHSMRINSMKSAIKNVIGSCHSLGLLIEGKTAQEINADIDNGLYEVEINNLKTLVSPEKKIILDSQLKDVQDKIQKELEKAAKVAAATQEPKEEKVISEEPTAQTEEAKEKVSEKPKSAERKDDKKK